MHAQMYRWKKEWALADMNYWYKTWCRSKL